MSAPATRSDLVGRVIDGRFNLHRWLGSSRGIDTYLTDYGDPSQKATIKLVPGDSADAEVRMSSWIAAANLSHPNLIRVFASGRCELESSPVLYVVSEYADEVLAEIIPERALTPQEAREMLGPAIDALAYLHSKGFVHGHLKPSNIMAVGDQLKLSADGLFLSGSIGKPSIERTIYDAPETIQGRIGTAADNWSLGATLIEILTQRPPAWYGATDAEPTVPDTVPEPFASIARECLRNDSGRRCTLEQIRARLDPRVAPPPAKKKTVQEISDRPAKSAKPAKPAKPADAAPPATQAPSAAPAAAVAHAKPVAPTKPAAPAEVAATPAEAVAPVRPDLFAGSAEPANPNRRVMVAVGAVALLIVLIVVWQVRSHNQSTPPVAQDQSAPAASTSETPAPSATPSQPPASAQAPAQAPAENPSPAAPAPDAGAPVAAGAATAPAQSGPQPSPQTPPQAPPARTHAAGGGTVKGTPVQQVQPDVFPKAMRTISGTVRNAVWVTVDEKGNVTAADFDTAGTSKYFASKSLQAAQKWTFQPAQIGGQPVESTWVLHFQYRRSGVTITPIETAP